MQPKIPSSAEGLFPDGSSRFFVSGPKTREKEEKRKIGKVGKKTRERAKSKKKNTPKKERNQEGFFFFLL